MPNQAFGVWIIPELVSRRRPCSINTGIERHLNCDWFLSSTFIDSHFHSMHPKISHALVAAVELGEQVFERNYENLE